MFVGEPVRNPSGECQVNAQSAADPLVRPPGCLGGVYWSGRCLLCSCLLPGWEQLRGNRGGWKTRVLSAENRAKGWGAGGESGVDPVTQTIGAGWKLVKNAESQVPLLVCGPRICILPTSPADVHVQFRLTSSGLVERWKLQPQTRDRDLVSSSIMITLTPLAAAGTEWTLGKCCDLTDSGRGFKPSEPQIPHLWNGSGHTWLRRRAVRARETLCGESTQCLVLWVMKEC